MNITKDLAIQSTEYIKQFCEKLRLDPNVDLMKAMSYQDIASCYISLQRIETFVTQSGEAIQPQSTIAVEPAARQGNSVEVETLQKLLQVSADKIAELQGVISGLHAKLHEPVIEEEIQVIELHTDDLTSANVEPAKQPKIRRKQISQIVNI